MKAKKTKTVIVRAEVHIIRDYPINFAVEDDEDEMTDEELKRNAVNVVELNFGPADFVPKANEIHIFDMGFQASRGKRKR